MLANAFHVLIFEFYVIKCVLSVWTRFRLIMHSLQIQEKSVYNVIFVSENALFLLPVRTKSVERLWYIYVG